MSKHFGATNGVKQGSMLSPIVFTLCLDDLIEKLEDNSDSCRNGMNYFGINRFADDLKLLSPSLLGLQRMLNILQAFSTSTGLTFNSKKTLCIQFHHRCHVNEITQYTIFPGSDKLQWYSQVKHLGHTFICCVNFSTDAAYNKFSSLGVLTV